MDIKIESEEPMELVRAALKANAGPPIFVRPDELHAFYSNSERTYSACLYSDQAFSKELELAPEKALILVCKEVSYRVIGSVSMPATAAGMMVVRDDGSLLSLVRGSASRTNDGTVQIYGANPSVIVFTYEALRSQRGRTLLDGDTLASFGAEKRDASGQWTTTQVVLNLAADIGYHPV